MYLSQLQSQSVLGRKGMKLFFGGVTPVLQHGHNNTDTKQHKHNGREDISALVSLSLGLVCPVLSLSCPLRRSRVLLTCTVQIRPANISVLTQWHQLHKSDSNSSYRQSSHCVDTLIYANRYSRVQERLENALWPMQFPDMLLVLKQDVRQSTNFVMQIAKLPRQV